MQSSIEFIDETAASRGPKITQLYRNLELLVEGDPARNSLFILEPASGPLLDGATADRLLIVDPPADVTTRFRLPEHTAILNSADPGALSLPAIQTVPGGVAHVRLGEHLLDVYSHTGGAVIHFPPVGVLYSGGFGSDQVPPTLASGSDGTTELDALRLLARLLKQHRIRLLLPRIGSGCSDLPTMMGRLAADVAYLHSLRRVALPLASQTDGPDAFQQIAESLLPTAWRNTTAWAIHRANLQALSANAA